MKYAVIFSNHEWSCATMIVGIKNNLEEAIELAKQQIMDVVENNEPWQVEPQNLDRLIENEHVEYYEDADINEESIVRCWYYTKAKMEVCIQKVEI
jgi:hypothetical protein